MLIRSNAFSTWILSGVSVTASTDFPIFTNEGVWLINNDETSSTKMIRRSVSGSSTPRTVSIYLRSGTINFAQLSLSGDLVTFANFNLLSGTVSSRSADVTSTMIPWRDGWYRCTMTYTSLTKTATCIGIVGSATSSRAKANTLNSNIYAAGA